ncbi:MAG: hypothetical protein Kow00105_14550 [Phycisphaeraceae bacterium]
MDPAQESHPRFAAPVLTGNDSGLTPEQVRALKQAKSNRSRINLAVTIATFNAWCLGIFAALSALALPFSFSIRGLFICLGLGLTARNEFRGRTLLKQLNTRAPSLLGYNQILLAVIIVGYCLWCLVDTAWGRNAFEQMVLDHPELATMLGSTGDLIRYATIAAYILVILLAVPYQAVMAWFYFSRSRHLREYLDRTPKWITEAQRHAA